jgi:hypothetical protein
MVGLGVVDGTAFVGECLSALYHRTKILDRQPLAMVQQRVEHQFDKPTWAPPAAGGRRRFRTTPLTNVQPCQTGLVKGS